MTRNTLLCTAVATGIALSLAAILEGANPPMKTGAPGPAPQVQRGRYLLAVGNCNDCHTANFAERNGEVPEKDWLLGSGPTGFSGPWGTTYAPNLRLTVSRQTETQWVGFAKKLKVRPPMPWFNLNQWSEPDLRALYQYIRSLGPVGQPAAPYLPPEQQPKPPYIQWIFPK